MSLGVVIPAYKDTFLEQTLLSFANQTRKDFTVYVGDDNSPYDLARICNAFKDRLTIQYTRFNNNIGAKNLVNQWTRCIELTRGEEWIWLFSDDDLVDTNCVESFYRQKERDNNEIDIYRFNTIVVDKEGKTTFVTPKSPLYESSEAMAYHLLLGKRGNSLADHIFSRKVYQQLGGLVFTEYAQGADWAMSISFSRLKGISTIQGANFYWRFSGFNISSRSKQAKRDMLLGHLQFLEWALQHFEYLKEGKFDVSYKMIHDAARANLKSVLIYHYDGFAANEIQLLKAFMQSKLDMGVVEVISDLFTVFRSTNPVMQFLVRIKNGVRRRLIPASGSIA